MKLFSKRFRKPVGQGLHQDGVVVIALGLVPLGKLVGTVNAHGKSAKVVLALLGDRQQVVGKRFVWLVTGLFGLLTQAHPCEECCFKVGPRKYCDVLGRCAPCGPEAKGAVGRELPGFNQPTQHGFAVGIKRSSLLAHNGIVKNGGKGAGKIPGLKKGGPVDGLDKIV